MANIQLLSTVAVLVVSVAAQHGHVGGHTESFIHFVGPVAGHAQPVVVIVKDKHCHGHHIVDYVLLAIVAVLTVCAKAEDDYDTARAESFIRFVGPVEGDPQPVIFKDEHGEKIVDYVAHPHYEYEYGVADHRTGDFHGQKESRDGHQVVGEYSLKEPSGNVRTVKYSADNDGFRADVHNSYNSGSSTEGHGSYEGLGYI